jgi:hypothetical protein
MNFCFKDRSGAFNQAVQRRCHPSLDGVENSSLHSRDHVAGIALIPVPVQFLGHTAELDDQVAG